ncbi:MAG: type IV secretion system protein [Parvibaculum sp.]
MSKDATTPPTNPYRQAGRVFADFLEADRRRTRLLVGLAVALFLALIASNVTMMEMYRERREHLALVEVDADTGRIVRKFQPSDYQPTDVQKSYIAREWIKFVRRRPADKLVMRDDLLWVYAHTAGAARERLDALFRDQNPYDQQNLRVVSGLTAFSKSADSYQISWKEEEFNKTGVKLGMVDHSALLTIARRVGAGTDVDRNPVDLFVIHFDWTVRESRS